MQPYRQGALDGTCGLYAIINAIRLAVRLKVDVCDSLYMELARAADRSWGFCNVIEYGLSANEVSCLLGKARQYLERHENLKLSWRKPFHKKPCTMSEFLHRIDAHQSQGGSVLIGITADDEHWTVIRKVTPRSLHFFDSDGMKQVSLSRLGLCKQAASRKIHYLEAYNAYFVCCHPRKNYDT